jgi:hypothetical protein
MIIRNSPATSGFPSPAHYGLGSPESRAAARAMADAKRGDAEMMLIGKRAGDGKVVKILVYKGGHMVEEEMRDGD